MRETAYAKLNLALHVRGREADGYHRLETVFAFAEDGDGLEAAEPEKPGTIELQIDGPFAALLGSREDNLVARAAERLADHYQVQSGVRLRLDKQLPVAAGIGGGSADAAAALRLLRGWWKLPDEPDVLHEIARGLGADVPACLHSVTMRGEGRGDRLRPVDGGSLSGTPVLLVNPLVTVPTGQVFARWSGIDDGPLGEALLGRNGLQAPAIEVAPVIGEVLETLSGARFHAMSGSGATCFGLFDNEAEREAAAGRIRADKPEWWVLISRLR